MQVGPSANVDSGWVTVARVRTAHGIRGEVTLQSEVDDLRRLQGQRLRLGDGQVREVVLEAVRPHGDTWVARLAGVTDRDQALALRGLALLVRPAQLPDLPAGRFYHHQVLGLRVETTQGVQVGTVTEILQPGGNDVYVVRTEGGTEILVPAARAVVRDIDLARGRLVIEAIPGLLDG